MTAIKKINLTFIATALTLMLSSCCLHYKTSVDKEIDKVTGNTITTFYKTRGHGGGYGGDGPTRKKTATTTTNKNGTIIFYEYKDTKINGCIGDIRYHETKKYSDRGKLIEVTVYKNDKKLVSKYDSLGTLISKQTEKIKPGE